MSRITSGAAHAAELRAHAMTAMRAGDEESARALVREADRLDPPVSS